jgi:hypothetical protein
VLTLLIIAAILAVLLVILLIAIWVAPEGEETEDGFRVVGPSSYQRFKARFRGARREKNNVGPLSPDQRP